MTNVKHTLKSDGAPFNEKGNRINPVGTAGDGRAMCACGALSDPLPTRAARKTWHAEHKGAPAPVEQPKPEKPAPKAKSTKAEKPVVEKATSQVLKTGKTTSVVTLKHVSKAYWVTLGREAGVALAKAMPGVQETMFSNPKMAILVKGETLGQAQAATDALDKFWEDAQAALRHFKRTDKKYRAHRRDTADQRKARYGAEKEFLAAWAKKYIKENVA